MPSMQKHCKATDKVVKCQECNKCFHVSCAKLSEKELGSEKETWYCKDCKAECGLCNGDVLNNHKAVQCDKCEMWVHNDCSFVTAQSDFEKASEFNGQFTDVFTKSEHSQVPLLDRSAPFMEDIVVTKEGVTKLLKGLNPSKAVGPDELHPRVLKELATELGTVFAHLFQQSIDDGEIPKEWSLANICPLFKKGDRSLACNYRPVSLTCVPCKLLEHIVCSNIMAHLDEHRLLSEKQHAFRKWHSSVTQLITVIDDWAKILDNQGQVDTFILDFEKAFDTPLMNFSKANCLAMELEEKL